MYAWIWRRLPFGLPGKIIGSLTLAAATTALLWYVVFPWADPLLPPYDDVQVTQDSGVPADPAVPDGVRPTLGDHELPYRTDQDNPVPSATPSR
jgi:hypothetical protein